MLSASKKNKKIVAGLFQKALSLHSANRIDEAEGLYKQALSLDVNDPDSLHMLGVIAFQKGQNRLSVDLIQKALEIKPKFPDALCNMANALKGMGELDSAIAMYRRALALKPFFPAALCNLGSALKGLGDLRIIGDRPRFIDGKLRHR